MEGFYYNIYTEGVRGALDGYMRWFIHRLRCAVIRDSFSEAPGWAGQLESKYIVHIELTAAKSMI